MSVADPTDRAPSFASRLAALPRDQFNAYMAGLNPEQLHVVRQAFMDDEIERALGQRADLGWRANPVTMAAHLTVSDPEPVMPYKYAMLLGDKFVEAVEGTSIRQIWVLPPRYGKSSVASTWGPVWAIDRMPRTRIINVSYGDPLAQKNAMAARDIFRAHGNALRTRLRQDRQNKAEFVTVEGGGILARGIRSGLTGRGAHGIVFDDPFKNWQEAHSAANRQRIDDEYRAVVTSRLDYDTSFVLIVMTRWHQDDLVGRLIDRMHNDPEQPQWDVTRIPEIAEEYNPTSIDPYLRVPDPLGRAPGEPIEPARFSLPSIRTKHAGAGSFLTAALYQGRPSPEEGNELQRSWWKIEDDLPPRYDLVITSWDLKMKDNESGDYVVGQLWGRTGSDMWLIDQLRGKWNQATTETAIALMAVRHKHLGIRAHHIEAKALGPEVMAELRRAKPSTWEVAEDIASQLGMTEEERAEVTGLRRRGMGALIPHDVKGDKTVRARAVSGSIEGGDVHLNPNGPWLPGFLDEAAEFPNGAHDDQVDAMSQALAILLPGQARSRSAAGDTIPKGPIDTRASAGGNTMTTNPGMPGQIRRRARGASSVIIPRQTGTGR